MTSSSLIAFLGACLACAGIISGIALPLHPDEFTTGALTDPLWRPVHLALLVSFVLSVPGVVGLYLRQARQLSTLGHVAFVIALCGSALSVALVATEALVLPAFAADRGLPLMDLLSGPLSSLGALFGLGVPIWIAGYVLLGIATARARVLPAAAGWLLVVGAVLAAVPVHFLGGAGPLTRIACGVIFGAGWAWSGLCVARGGVAFSAGAHAASSIA
jgi:hypothetical protein